MIDAYSKSPGERKHIYRILLIMFLLVFEANVPRRGGGFCSSQRPFSFIIDSLRHHYALLAPDAFLGHIEHGGRNATRKALCWRSDRHVGEDDHNHAAVQRAGQFHGSPEGCTARDADTNAFLSIDFTRDVLAGMRFPVRPARMTSAFVTCSPVLQAAIAIWSLL